MDDFKAGSMSLSQEVLASAQALFASYKLDDQEMLDVVAEVFNTTEYLLDPHTAIGVQAARKTRRDPLCPWCVWPPRIQLNSPRPLKIRCRGSAAFASLHAGFIQPRRALCSAAR